jgi:hypothetical protein
MVEGVNSSMIYLIHCKNFCKGHNEPLSSTTVTKENKKLKAGCCWLTPIILFTQAESRRIML